MMSVLVVDGTTCPEQVRDPATVRAVKASRCGMTWCGTPFLLRNSTSLVMGMAAPPGMNVEQGWVPGGGKP